MTRTAVVAALALIAAALAPIAARADAAAGERLAQRWCAACHVVDGGNAATPVPQGPPSFRSIARRLTAGQLRVFLSRPHAPMQDLALTRTEIGDLVAYIKSLK